MSCRSLAYSRNYINKSCSHLLQKNILFNPNTLLFRIEFIRKLDSLLYESGKHFLGITPYRVTKFTSMSH
jgi:hypothetical protein